MTISVQKSAYDPKSKEDGLRILVMQYWPRGVRKEKVDAWYRELGTSKELIKAWKAGRLTWPQFKKRYIKDLKDRNKQQLIRELAQRSKTERITLLCGCRDAIRCHRMILKDEIMKATT
jgi:uncharacterized protein YeaO (DUF488 family)